MKAIVNKIAGYLAVFLGALVGTTGLMIARFLAIEDFGFLLAATVALCSILILVYSFVAIRTPRKAAFLFLVPAPIAGLCAAAAALRSMWISYDFVLSEVLVVLFVALITPACFGLFWYTTNKYGWRPLASSFRVSAGRRILEIAFCFALAMVVLSWGAISLAMRQPDVGECFKAKPPISGLDSPRQIVVIAKVIGLGPSGTFTDIA